MQVMIFGAKSIALGVLRALQELYTDFEDVGFMVTGKSGNPETLGGLPVFELDQFGDKKICILIATPEDTHHAIVNALEERGFHNHICIDSEREAKLMGRYYQATGMFRPLREESAAKEKRCLQVTE